jgi:hypothetical protein
MTRLSIKIIALLALLGISSSACVPTCPTSTAPVASTALVSPTLAPTITPTPGLTPTQTLTTPLHPEITPTAVCTYTWFFQNPLPNCPGQPPVYSVMVMQRFEYGFMLWRAQPGPYGSQIYTFFTDNQWPYWNPTNDTWTSSMPESDPGIVPPTGYYQPVRSFGVKWRTTTIPQGTAIVTLRERLGWALEEEFSLGEQPMQCHSGDSYLYGCFLAGPDNVIYAIYPNNVWSIWYGLMPASQ